MNVEELKLNFYQIKNWVLVSVEDIWIWIGVMSNCGWFYQGLIRTILIK